MYKCKRCKKVFDRKSNYECHVNRIFKCSLSNSNKTAKKLTIPQCPNCGKIFTRPYGVKKHLSVCKNNKSDSESDNDESRNNNININLFLMDFNQSNDDSSD